MQTDLNQLQDIFIKMSEDGFKIDAPLKWNFYFMDDNEKQLKMVYDEMRDHNYVLENLEETEKNLWTLQVSKVDILDAVKLHKRNIAFNELAEYCGVKEYDGWDVEKV